MYLYVFYREWLLQYSLRTNNLVSVSFEVKNKKKYNNYVIELFMVCL